MPKKYEYKTDKKSADTRVRITLSKEQYNQLVLIAKRHQMDADDLLERYIKRMIADYSHP
jgi:hypothetical protein